VKRLLDQLFEDLFSSVPLRSIDLAADLSDWVPPGDLGSLVSSDVGPAMPLYGRAFSLRIETAASVDDALLRLAALSPQRDEGNLTLVLPGGEASQPSLMTSDAHDFMVRTGIMVHWHDGAAWHRLDLTPVGIPIWPRPLLQTSTYGVGELWCIA
jgi:hypothetical protein